MEKVHSEHLAVFLLPVEERMVRGSFKICLFHYVCMSAEVVGSPSSEVIGGCLSPDMCWEPDSSLLQGQYMLLTSKLSLQPHL